MAQTAIVLDWRDRKHWSNTRRPCIHCHKPTKLAAMVLSTWPRPGSGEHQAHNGPEGLIILNAGGIVPTPGLVSRAGSASNRHTRSLKAEPQAQPMDYGS